MKKLKKTNTMESNGKTRKKYDNQYLLTQYIELPHMSFCGDNDQPDNSINENEITVKYKKRIKIDLTINFAASSNTQEKRRERRREGGLGGEKRRG